MMDSLFQSFDRSISVNGFAELSGSIFNWLEEYCKPQVLHVNMHIHAYLRTHTHTHTHIVTSQHTF